MKRRQGKFGNFISYILILIVVVGSLGAIAYFTGGFTRDFNTFSVDCNGRNVTTSASGFEMTVESPLTVDINYGITGNEINDFSVKVIPNVIEGKDFDFKLDGETYSYQEEKDLTDGFEIEYKENSFTIKPKGGITDILQAMYPNNVVEDCRYMAYRNMYTLVITAQDGETNVLLHFTIPEHAVDVLLDKEVIIF